MPGGPRSSPVSTEASCPVAQERNLQPHPSLCPGRHFLFNWHRGAASPPSSAQPRGRTHLHHGLRVLQQPADQRVARLVEGDHLLLLPGENLALLGRTWKGPGNGDSGPHAAQGSGQALLCRRSQVTEAPPCMPSPGQPHVHPRYPWDSKGNSWSWGQAAGASLLATSVGATISRAAPRSPWVRLRADGAGAAPAGAQTKPGSCRPGSSVRSYPGSGPNLVTSWDTPCSSHCRGFIHCRQFPTIPLCASSPPGRAPGSGHRVSGTPGIGDHSSHGCSRLVFPARPSQEQKRRRAAGALGTALCYLLVLPAQQGADTGRGASRPGARSFPRLPPRLTPGLRVCSSVSLPRPAPLPS